MAANLDALHESLMRIFDLLECYWRAVIKWRPRSGTHNRQERNWSATVAERIRSYCWRVIVVDKVYNTAKKAFCEEYVCHHSNRNIKSLSQTVQELLTTDIKQQAVSNDLM